MPSPAAGSAIPDHAPLQQWQINRLRLGDQLGFGFIIIFALADLNMSRELMPMVYLFKLVHTAALLTHYMLLSRDFGRRHAAAVTQATLAVFCAMTAARARWVGDYTGTVQIFVGLSFVLAVGLAWHWVEQVKSALIIAAAMIVSQVGWPESFEPFAAPATLAALTLIGFSVYVARGARATSDLVLTRTALAHRESVLSQLLAGNSNDELWELNLQERTWAPLKRPGSPAPDERPDDNAQTTVAFLARFAPEDRTALESWLRGIFSASPATLTEDDVSLTLNLRLVAPEQPERRALLRSFPILDGTPLLRRVGVWIVDTTRRHALQAALDESQLQFRELLESVSEMVAVADGTGRRVTGWNAAAVRTLGYSIAEAMNLTARDFFSEGGRQAISELAAAAQLGRPIQPAEITIRCKDGRTITAEVSLAQVRRNHDVIAWIFLARDTTERRRTHQELVEALSRLRLACSASNMGVWEIDLETRQVTEDDMTRALLGHHSPTGLDEYSTLVDPADHDRIVGEYLQSVENHRPFDLEFRGRADGRWFRVQGTFAPGDAVEQPPRLFGVLQDITAKKQAEDVLRRERDHAESEARAKGRFLAMMSHEIRTPMNGVLGMTQILAGTSLDERQRRCVELIESSGQGLLTILNDILDYSKFDAGKLELEPQPIDLRHLVQEVVNLLEPSAAARGLVLHTDVSAAVPPLVNVDPTRLRQILTNVVANAIKFTEAGEVHVAIDARPGEDDQCHVDIRVRDTGIGIPPERLSLLFEPFQQLDTFVTRRFGGTGLGLAISRQLAEHMGGSIRAESIPGTGSTFFISIMARTADASSQPAPAATLPTVRLQLSTELKILVAEDTPLNQAVITAMLERLGHTSVVVENGRAAVAAAEREPYDIIFMDVVMPVMNGLDACRHIRRLPGRERTRIVAMTAGATDDDRHRCREAGMDDYLAKPILFDDLKRTLARSVEAIASRHSAHASTSESSHDIGARASGL